MLRAASGERRYVTTTGGGTRSRNGRQTDPGTHLSTAGLRQVIEHTPAELTVTLEAGLYATELADRLSAAGQWWPQADIRPGSTVGRILASGASGRGRLRHGPVRDSLLEVVLVTGDGRIVKAGGRTVKGVAGYDIPRLAVGSLGTLGVITQVTLKLWPAPPARGWFAMEGSLDERLAAATRIRAEQWRPAAILLTPGRLSIDLVGSTADVTAPAETSEAGAPAEPVGRGLVDVGVAPIAVAPVVRELERPVATTTSPSSVSGSAASRSRPRRTSRRCVPWPRPRRARGRDRRGRGSAGGSVGPVPRPALRS